MAGKLISEEELDRELRSYGVDPEAMVQHAFQKVCVLARKQAETIAALRKTHWDTNRGKTHWEGCWREHYQCAMQLIEELLGALRRSPCTCNSEGTFTCARCTALRIQP